VNTFPGHNSSLFVLGVMILWFGWYGFNPGSQQAIIGFSSSVGTAAVTTTLSPAAAGMSALTTHALIKYVEEGAPLTRRPPGLHAGALRGFSVEEGAHLNRRRPACMPCHMERPL
jgi:ammonia channel protein AmtB